MQFVNALHWIHLTLFAPLALAHMLSWLRLGKWLPNYVHHIGLIAGLIGFMVYATLPPTPNPAPFVQRIAPMILPGVFMGLSYAVALFGVGLHWIAYLFGAPRPVVGDDPDEVEE